MAYQLAAASHDQKCGKLYFTGTHIHFFLIFNVSCSCQSFGGVLSPKLAVHHKHTCTVDLYLSRLIGMMGHPDMQKIWIIGFFC